MEAGDTIPSHDNMADFFDFGEASISEDQSRIVTSAECEAVDITCLSNVNAQR